MSRVATVIIKVLLSAWSVNLPQKSILRKMANNKLLLIQAMTLASPLFHFHNCYAMQAGTQP